MFPLQPKTLRNDLLSLKPLEPEDFEPLFAVASDPLLWEQHPNKLRYQKAVFWNFFEGALASKGAFLVTNNATGSVVGSSRFYEYSEKKQSVLIGYTFIGRAYWGKGYNRSLKKMMLDHAFQYVNQVVFHVGANNFRSQRALEKIGAVKIDEMEVSYYGEDSKLNYIYSINKETYRL